MRFNHSLLRECYRNISIQVYSSIATLFSGPLQPDWALLDSRDCFLNYLYNPKASGSDWSLYSVVYLQSMFTELNFINAKNRSQSSIILSNLDPG